jgi:hypothetical protein
MLYENLAWFTVLWVSLLIVRRLWRAAHPRVPASVSSPKRKMPRPHRRARRHRPASHAPLAYACSLSASGISGLRAHVSTPADTDNPFRSEYMRCTSARNCHHEPEGGKNRAAERHGLRRTFVNTTTQPQQKSRAMLPGSKSPLCGITPQPVARLLQERQT